MASDTYLWFFWKILDHPLKSSFSEDPFLSFSHFVSHNPQGSTVIPFHPGQRYRDCKNICNKIIFVLFLARLIFESKISRMIHWNLANRDINWTVFIGCKQLFHCKRQNSISRRKTKKLFFLNRIWWHNTMLYRIVFFQRNLWTPPDSLELPVTRIHVESPVFIRYLKWNSTDETIPLEVIVKGVQ